MAAKTFLSRFIDKQGGRPGRVKRTKRVPSERLECVQLVAWLREQGWRFTHVANETSSKAQALANRSMGTSKGFPDFVIFVSGYVVFIEMKRTEGGRASKEQKEWIDFLQKAGHHAEICDGFEEAKKFLTEVSNG